MPAGVFYRFSRNETPFFLDGIASCRIASERVSSLLDEIKSTTQCTFADPSVQDRDSDPRVRRACPVVLLVERVPLLKISPRIAGAICQSASKTTMGFKLPTAQRLLLQYHQTILRRVRRS
jgi:hypothetical protein